MPPSDTFFTAPPDWSWLVILYFFFGGIAGGSLLPVAAMLGPFGDAGGPPAWPASATTSPSRPCCSARRC